MASQITAPYGSWKSPVTPEFITANTVNLSSVEFSGEDIYWVELRPGEGGRQVLVRRTPDGRTHDMVPPPYSVRTRVHEYGGRSYAVAPGGTVYFSNFKDQRLYRVRPGEEPQPLTPEAPLRYADQQIDPRRGRLLCILEDHSQSNQQAENSLVSLRLEDGGGLMVLASGNDFYASPALSPDGERLAWLTWNHPNMPWDGTELWLGNLNADGSLASSQKIAGGIDESIYQPEWSPDRTLYFVSDRTGWWNLYRWNGEEAEALYPMEAEFGQPQWNFGRKSYGFLSADEILCRYMVKGISHLGLLDVNRKSLEPVEIPYQSVFELCVTPAGAIFIGGSPTETPVVALLDPESKQLTVLRSTQEMRLDPGYISIPEAIEFPTEGGKTAHAFYYPPANKDYTAPEGEKPPLIVMSHGGPTGMADTTLDPRKQYWTSRGFGVLDVNYGGSSGFGREYRERLKGQWGRVDVEDCVNGARYLVEQGRVDGERLAIRGGSAGGYTTLCALTFQNLFKAGASYYGVGDLGALARDTHKFESRYLDGLVGPYPEREDLYREFSPLFNVEQLNCPIIFFQGLEDEVVPPAQSEEMYRAVKSKGLPTAYITFEGEQHGFRSAANIIRSLEAEYCFYAHIFGFEPADEIEPVEIDNLP